MNKIDELTIRAFTKMLESLNGYRRYDGICALAAEGKLKGSSADLDVVQREIYNKASLSKTWSINLLLQLKVELLKLAVDYDKRIQDLRDTGLTDQLEKELPDMISRIQPYVNIDEALLKEWVRYKVTFYNIIDKNYILQDPRGEIT